VAQAIIETRRPEQKDFYGVLGEPQLDEQGGYFRTVRKVVIPVDGTEFGDAGSLVFDVPEGGDVEDNGLLALLNAFDLSIDAVDQLEGETVPIEYSGGNVVVMWDRLGDD
jgi:hypothetical protein